MPDCIYQRRAEQRKWIIKCPGGRVSEGRGRGGGREGGFLREAGRGEQSKGGWSFGGQ